MGLSRKILLITIGILAISLLVSSMLNVISFRSKYTDALLTGSFGIGYSIESLLTELLALGLPLDSLSGMDNKLVEVVEKNSHIAYAGVTDELGVVLFHSDESLIGYHFTDPVAQKILKEKSPIWQIYDRFDGERYYDVSIPLFDHDEDYVGVVRLGFLSSIVDQKVEEAIAQIIINVLVTFVVIALLLNLFLRRSVIDPVKQLSGYAESIAKGKFDSKTAIRSKDEIGRLSYSLHEMGGILQKQIVELKQSGRELEQRIEMRTQELADINQDLKKSNAGLSEALEREKELSDALRNSEERFRMLFEKSKATMLTIDPGSGGILAANHAAEIYYGYSVDQLLSMNIGDINVLTDAEISREMDLAKREERNHFYFQHALASGEIRDVEVHSGPIDWGGKQVLYSIIHDITDRKKAEAELDRIAHYDSLTGLPNRLLKSDRLNQAIVRAKRRGHLVAVCYLDLDGFKPINDKYGHDTGDLVLVEIAKRLEHTVRGGDTVSRIGGDEFVIILTELGSQEGCEFILQRVMQVIEEPIILQDVELIVSASIGFTLYPSDDSDADLLLRHADQAMYVAKDRGKSCIHLFDPEQDRQVKAFRENYDRLSKAITDNEFVLYYQPKVNMYTGQVIGMEALLRWHHPEQGMLAPGSFLHIMTDTDLEIELGKWVIDRALQQQQLWQSQGMDLTVSVNIGPHHLQHSDFVHHVKEALVKYDTVPANKLELEILETTSIEDLSRIIQPLLRCQEMGVQITLDDFGTGYSSLTYFHRLPVNTLKIDQSFVCDMLEDPQDLAIVESVVRLALAFHHPVIAEGVESLEHGAALLRLGCQLGQGYGIARPMPAGDVTRWREEWRNNTAWQTLNKRLEIDSSRDVESAIVGHQQWLTQSLEAITNADSQSTRSLLDSNSCPFGRWFHGAGYFKYGHLEQYGKLRENHEHIHLLAEELRNLSASGNQKHAQQRLEELISMHDQFIEELQSLVTRVN
ncbi:MAG: EAL domain-containing protein [Candidatus Thiodiazotropha endolucinida]|nr:EAL domain-containing protein [Candidatus Thiodiazotropha taylori]MCW4320976.1 EAL domain-containing protein [Candidatus Thiodiazotropha taylori]